jgi:hypothetical protein
MANKYGLYGVGIGAVATPDVVVGGITAENISPGSTVRAEAMSGEVYPRFGSLVAQNPRGSFSTRAIAAAMTEITTLGKALAFGGDVCNLYMQLRADKGTRGSGSVHRKMTISNGLIIPRRISGSHQGDAELSADIIATWDGTNDPIIIADTSALPSVTDTERFAIAKATIGAIVIDEEFDIAIDFGMKEEVEGKQSEVWPRTCSIQEVSATMTIKSRNGDLLKSTNIPLLGKAATHANSKVYLRKRANAGTFVTDVTAEHVSFTICGLAVLQDVFDARGNATGEMQVVITGTFDGTNAPIVGNYATAIS